MPSICIAAPLDQIAMKAGTIASLSTGGDASST